MAAGGRVSGNVGSDAWNAIGDPGGWLTGQNTEGFGGVKKMLFGDPDALKKAYDQAMGMSRQMGQESKDFLMNQENRALQNYYPMQRMFQSMYGTQGLRPAQAPQAYGPMTAYGSGK